MVRRTFQLSLKDLADTHNADSSQMILEAAALARPRHVAVLGCGTCVDIPIRELKALGCRLNLVDMDGAALKSVKSRYFNEPGDSHTLYQSDLTGLIPQMELQLEDDVCTSSDPLHCLDTLAEWLTATTPVFWQPPRHEKYDLLICSAVLTQLQARVRQHLESMFLTKFSSHARLLHLSPRWRNSVLKFARKIETAFVQHLESLTSRAGLIYLSDTVHVCWLTQSGSETFTTDGAWIATRTARLADYLQVGNEIVSERRWQWIRKLQEDRFCGRLYGVQALVYKPLQNE